MLTACSANNKKETNTGLSTGANSDKVSEDEKKATTEDTAVVMAIDTKNKTLTSSNFYYFQTEFECIIPCLYNFCK